MEEKEDYSTSESEISDEEISAKPKSQPIVDNKSLPSQESQSIVDNKSSTRNLDQTIDSDKSLPKEQTPGQVLSKDSQMGLQPMPRIDNKSAPKSKFKVDSLAYYKDQARTLGIKGFSKKSKKVLKELVAKKLNPEQVSSVNSEELSSSVEPSRKILTGKLDQDENSGQETSKVVEADRGSSGSNTRETSIISGLKSQLCDQLSQMCRDCSPKITISKYDSSLKMTRPKNKEELIKDLTKYCLEH